MFRLLLCLINSVFSLAYNFLRNYKKIRKKTTQNMAKKKLK